MHYNNLIIPNEVMKINEQVFMTIKKMPQSFKLLL